MSIIKVQFQRQMLNVEWIRTSNKHLYLHLKNKHQLQVRAPHDLTLTQVKMFIEQNLPKFQKRLQANLPQQFYNFHDHWVLINNKKYQIKYLSGFKMNNARLSSGVLWLLTVNGHEDENHQVLNDFLKQLLKHQLEKKQSFWEKKMQTVHHAIQIRHKSSSWASNSLKTKTISYNLWLIHFSHEVINYIIVHELAHDFFPNHSQQFWAKVASFCPNYAEVKQKLKH